MIPDHGTKHEENPSSHHGGICKDGHMDVLTNRQMDQTLSYILHFHLGRGVSQSEMCYHLATKITMDAESACDSSEFESDEGIVDVTEQEIGTMDTESDEDGENICDNNNSRRQSTFSRPGKIQGNWLKH